MAASDRSDHREGGFPNIGQPALRALKGVGVTSLAAADRVARG